MLKIMKELWDKNQDKLRLYQVEDELELFDADRAAELERLKREKERTI